MPPKIYLFSTSSYPRTIHVNSLDVLFIKTDIDFSKYDCLIITSKQISEYFKEYSLYSSLPALCVSKKTALAYRNIGGKILNIGNGYGDDLARIVKTYPKNTKWLYLRAKEVASDFVKVCNDDGYLIQETIVYETHCSKNILNIDVESDAILIFTSPSSVKCFLKNNKFTDKHKVIVIGKTTANTLPSNISCQISAHRTINSCLELV